MMPGISSNNLTTKCAKLYVTAVDINSSQTIIASLGMLHIYVIVLILAICCTSLAYLSNYLNVKIHKKQVIINIYIIKYKHYKFNFILICIYIYI